MSQTICICGAGTMGSGIAQVSAHAGFPTILHDLNLDVLETARLHIEHGLQYLTGKGKITIEEKEKIQHSIQYSTDLKKCKADIFIEAIIEKPEIKISLINQLAELNEPDCIFASNTSSLSLNAIAGQIKNPGRFIGMHFFNPAPVMKLVEVVNTNHTNEETTRRIIKLAGQMGKTPVVCKDSPGFIVNRVARPFYIESLRLAEEGISDFDGIDTLLEATGFKMGPFKLMDLIGNDINYTVSCSLYDQLNKPVRLKPSGLQKEKVEKGELGRKTGKGYYNYNS
ncbi:MAG: 3-hydroxyacyl-CoA dehydrogenase family protein [Chitinophagaceae bacterium]